MTLEKVNVYRIVPAQFSGGEREWVQGFHQVPKEPVLQALFILQMYELKLQNTEMDTSRTRMRTKSSDLLFSLYYSIKIK